MVSFSCEVCNDVVKKSKLESHRGQCHHAYFTCIDCNTTFDRDEYKGHTSCISEAQKYQGPHYKPEKGKNRKEKQAAPMTEPVLEKTKMPANVKMVNATPAPAPVAPVAEEKSLTKKEKKEKVNKAYKARKDRRKAEKEGKPVETEEEVTTVVVEEAMEDATKEIEAMPKKDTEDKKGKKGKKEKKYKAEEGTQESTPVAEPEASAVTEEPKEMSSPAKKDKRVKNDKKRKAGEMPSEPAVIDFGEREAFPAKKPKKEMAPKVAPEDKAIGTAFLALFQKGHPLTFAKALARLGEEHGVDAQKKLFSVLRVNKVKQDIVLSVV